MNPYQQFSPQKPVLNNITDDMTLEQIYQAIRGQPEINQPNPYAQFGVQQRKTEQYGPPKPNQGNNAGSGKAFAYGITGGQIPFGNVITSGLAAGAVAPFVDENFGELYDQAQADTKATQEANPGATLGGNVLGIASTLPVGFSKAIIGKVPTEGIRGALNAIPQGLSAVNRFVRGGEATKDATRLAKLGRLGLQSVKAAAVAAPTGALYGAGQADAGHRLEGARRGAGVAAGLGFASPAAGAAASSLNEKLGKVIIPTSEQIRQAGSKYFQLAEQRGGTLSAKEANKFYDKILNIRPQTLEGSVFKGESPVAKILDNVASLKDRPMTLQAAMEVDEALGELAYSTMDNFGKITSEGKKFLDMQGVLRNIWDEAEESMVEGGKAGFQALKEARKYWSTSLRLREIERIIEKAKGREQPVTAIKNGFTNLLNRGDKLKGYSTAEVKAIQKAAKTGVVTDLVKLAGSGLVPIGSGVTGLSGGPLGGAIGFATGAAIQQGAKATGVARQMSRAKGAAKAVAERSGMVQKKPLVQVPKNLKEILNLPPKEAKRLLTIQDR